MIKKVLIIGFCLIVLFVGLYIAKGLITDRVRYKNEAVKKITDSWGGNINIVAPILNIQYRTKTVEKQKTIEKGKEIENKIEKTVVKSLKLSPKNLDAKVNIVPTIRYIGIFKVPVFVADIDMTGNFDFPNDIKNINKNDILKTEISLETNNLKGISIPEFYWNEESLNFEPAGSNINVIKNYNLQALSSKITLVKSNTFKLSFKIKGSNEIKFLPLAKDNKFFIHSTWKDPNFSGDFLPDTKNINDNGFEANWNINYLATGINENLLTSKSYSGWFSTKLLIPVDNYRAVERATKYGNIFVLLVFFLCFVVELVGKRFIHPFQYLLVGLAMIIFYILLLSISEFISFFFAYLISAGAIVLLVLLYTRFAILKDINIKQTAGLTVFLSGLYAYLYVLLQLRDYSLILGSVALFVVLAVVMYATRNIDWKTIS